MVGLLLLVTLTLIFRHEASYKRELRSKRATSIHQLESKSIAAIALPEATPLVEEEDRSRCKREPLVLKLLAFDITKNTVDEINNLFSNFPKSCKAMNKSFDEETLMLVKGDCENYANTLKDGSELDIYYARRSCDESLRDARRLLVYDLLEPADLFITSDEKIITLYLDAFRDQKEDGEYVKLISRLINEHPNKYVALRAANFSTTGKILERVLMREGDDEDFLEGAPTTNTKEEVAFASDLFYELESMSPDDVDLPALEVTLARAAVNSYEETKEVYQDLLNKYPSYPSLYYLLAKNESRFNNNDEAILYIEEALNTDPDNAGYKETLRLLETGHLRHRYIFDSRRIRE